MFFSIVICTYNPIEKNLERALRSCLRQSLIQSEYEIILVDNNSNKDLSAIPFISDLLKKNELNCLTEKKQGLVHARICGIKAARAPVIVFVDDDNVLAADYLENLKVLIRAYPDVAVWGPGNISLDFPDGAPKWIKSNFSALYQEKNTGETRSGAEIEWQQYYPAGSGLTATKKILDKYANDFASGKITATGRTGKSMASAEDSQIVWTAVKMGFQAGTSQLLKLVHIIPGSRTNLKYLCNLNYGMSYSYYRALKEMFPDYKFPYKKRNLLQKAALFLRTLKKSKLNPAMSWRFYAVENAWLRGFDDYISHKS